MIKIKNLIWEAFSDKIKQNVISRWKSQNIENDDQEKFDYYLDTFSNNISNKIFNNMPKDPIAYTYSTNNRNPGLKKYTFYDLKKIIDDNFSYDEYKGKQMAAMPVDTMPPIVFDPINQSIIDGTHRANVRASAGDTTILAYVGVPETYYESDNDEDE